MNEDLAITILEIIKKGETFGPMTVFNEIRQRGEYFELTEADFKITWNYLKEINCLSDHDDAHIHRGGVKISPNKDCLSLYVQRRSDKMFSNFHNDLLALLNTRPHQPVNVTSYLNKFWAGHLNESEIRRQVSELIQEYEKKGLIKSGSGYHNILTGMNAMVYSNDPILLIITIEGRKELAGHPATNTTTNNLYVGVNQGAVAQGSDFSQSDLTQSVTTTPNINESITKSKLWYNTALFKYFIWPVLAGLAILAIWLLVK
jgi:hypothetical protein